MRKRSNMWNMAAAVGLMAGLHGVPCALAASDMEKCQAAKVKAGGKNVLDTVKCHEKALKTAMPLDDACFMKVGDRLDKAVAKADTIGSCPGTVNGIEAAVTACVGSILGEAFGIPTTTSTSTTTSTTLPCSPGKSLGGHCWYQGDLGANCNTTCAAHGKAYHPATASYAGSSGTALNCEAVLNAFGAYFDSSYSGNGGLGCSWFLAIPPVGFRDTDPTLETASHPSVIRYCACQ